MGEVFYNLRGVLEIKIYFSLLYLYILCFKKQYLGRILYTHLFYNLFPPWILFCRPRAPVVKAIKKKNMRLNFSQRKKEDFQYKNAINY